MEPAATKTAKDRISAARLRLLTCISLRIPPRWAPARAGSLRIEVAVLRRLDRVAGERADGIQRAPQAQHPHVGDITIATATTHASRLPGTARYSARVIFRQHAFLLRGCLMPLSFRPAASDAR